MKTKFFKNIFFSLFSLTLLISCKGNQKETGLAEESKGADIEVIYFYGKQRCATCKAMEKYAREAMDSVFPEKINDGSLVFRSVDFTTPEGEKLADSFEVASSSIFIVNNKPEVPEKIDMTGFGFRNARNNRQIYKQGVIDQINKFLD